MERGSWPAALTGLALLAFFILTIDRVPLPWNDEIYNASAVLSAVRGGSGAPTVLPPGRWESFPRIYGPVYFRLAAALSPNDTVTAVSARLPCVLGAALIGIAAAWLALALGSTAAWAAFAFALVLATPDLTAIATNGRVDSLAIGLQLLGLAAVAQAVRGETSRSAAVFGVVAGSAWGAAMLTSPRVFPSLGAIALVSPGLLLLTADDRRRAFVAGAAAVALTAVVYFSWTFSSGWGLSGHVVYLRNAARGDWFNSPVAGESRQWGLYLRPLVTFAVAAATALLALLLRTDESTPSRVARLALCAAVVTTAYWIATANHTFFHSAYFTLPMIAGALAVTPHAARPRVRRAAGAVWAIGAAAFFAVDAGKVLEAARSWRRSDPAPLQAFVKEQIPRGSIVYGPDRDYFYAVENSGSEYRSAWLRPFPSDNLGLASQPTVVVAASKAQQYLLWPAGDPPPADPCLRGVAVATFHARRAPAMRVAALNRIAREQGYADTNLFVLDRRCGFSEARAER